MEILNRWSEQKSGELYESHHPSSKASYKMSVFDFVKSRDYLNDNSFANELFKEIEKGKHIHYSMKCDTDTKSGDVSTNIKTADNQIFLPGSSIKGFIRTALLKDALYKMLENESYKRLCFDKLKNELNSNPKKEKFGNFIEQDIFYCGTKQKDKVIYHDEKFDTNEIHTYSYNIGNYLTGISYTANNDNFTTNYTYTTTGQIFQKIKTRNTTFTVTSDSYSYNRSGQLIEYTKDNLDAYGSSYNDSLDQMNPTLDATKWIWGYKYNHAGQREQKRLLKSPHGDDGTEQQSFAHNWEYYMNVAIEYKI